MYAMASRKRKFSEQVVPGAASGPHDSAALARRQSGDSAFPVEATNPFDDPDYPIPDFQRVYDLMRDPEKGLQLADRRWRIMTYSKCFIGSDAVQWMVSNLSVDRKTAVSTGQRLMEAGIIHHVTHSEPFCDQYYFYRFQEDDDTNVLNMKRIWDPAIPTRDAVDVSKDLLTRLALLCEEHRKRILDAKTPPKPSPAAPSSSIGSFTNFLPRTPSLPTSRPPTSAERLPVAISPSLSHPLSATPPLADHSPALLSTPHRMPSSTSFVVAPQYSVGDDVDYSTLAKSDDFRQYTLKAAELQRVQLIALNHDERIAFFVNCYNALCLHAHVAHLPPNSLFRRWAFFRSLSYRIAGLDMTLDDIEHGILRGNKRAPMIKIRQQLRPYDPKCQHVLTKRDGRIHFVISAGTRSDPPIRILDGENVQEELHEATVEFLSYNVKLDLERKTVTLPRIFLWYAEDFPSPERSLLLWVARYLPVELSQNLIALVNSSPSAPAITYENFDWANAEARFNASVVRRKRRKLERETSNGLTPLQNQGTLDFVLSRPSIDVAPLIPENPFNDPQFENSSPLLRETMLATDRGSTRNQLEELFAPIHDISTGNGNQEQVHDSESAGISASSKTNGKQNRSDRQKSEDEQPADNTSHKA